MLEHQTGNFRTRRLYGRLSRWLGLHGPLKGLTISPELKLGMELRHFAEPIVHLNSLTAITGNGTVTLATVFPAEIWEISWVWWGVASGTYTIDYLTISDVAGVVELAVDDTPITTNRTLGAGAFQPKLWLYPGDSFRANITNYSAPGNAQMRFRLRRFEVSGGN